MAPTASLFDEIAANNKRLLAKFDPDVAIELLGRVSGDRSYRYLPVEIRNLWLAVSSEFGEDGFDAFQKLTMLRLIGLFDAISRNKCYTERISKCFEVSFRRIIDSIANSEFVSYRNENDILLKDLGLCRQHVFPAGAQLVEPDSGFHRSLMFRGGASQAFRLVRLLLETGGNKHWYQIHTHLSELEDFTPPGWDECYLRLAEMMTVNPVVRGLWGGSWFYDPALGKISPRLEYLRRVPTDNGAALFFSNIDVESGALSKSATRKRAYEKGEYIPRSFALLWPRRHLLAWAEKMRARGLGAEIRR